MGRQFLWRLKELQAGLDPLGGWNRVVVPLQWGQRHHVDRSGITPSVFEFFEKRYTNKIYYYYYYYISTVLEI